MPGSERPGVQVPQALTSLVIGSLSQEKVMAINEFIIVINKIIIHTI